MVVAGHTDAIWIGWIVWHVIAAVVARNGDVARSGSWKAITAVVVLHAAQKGCRVAAHHQVALLLDRNVRKEIGFYDDGKQKHEARINALETQA